MPIPDRCECPEPIFDPQDVLIDSYGTLLSTVSLYERRCALCQRPVERYERTVSRLPFMPELHCTIDPDECDHSQRFEVDPDTVRVELADPETERPYRGPMSWWETIKDIVASTVQTADASCKRCGTVFRVTRADVTPTHGSELWVPA